MSDCRGRARAMGSASDAITVYLETSLSTRLATTVGCNDTLPLLKRKLEDEHRLSFGDVKIISLKVNQNRIFYTLSDTISIKQALCGGVGAHTECHLFADVEKTKAKMTKSERHRQKRRLKKAAARLRENNSLASIQEVHLVLPSTLDVKNNNTDAAGHVEHKTDASVEKLGQASQSKNKVIASSVVLAEEVKKSTTEDSEMKRKKETTLDSSSAAYVLETPLESHEDQEDSEMKRKKETTVESSSAAYVLETPLECHEDKEISTKSEAGKSSFVHSKVDCVLPRPDTIVSKKVFKGAPKRQNQFLRTSFQNRTSFPKKNTIPKAAKKQSVADGSGAEILAEMNQDVVASNSKKAKSSFLCSEVDCVVSMLDKTSSKEVAKSATNSISSDASCKIHTILEADKKQSVDDGLGTETLDDGSGTVIEQAITVSNSEKEKSDKKDQNKMDEKRHLDVTLNVVASGKVSGQERGEVSNSCKSKKTSAESVAPENRKTSDDGSGIAIEQPIFVSNSEKEKSDQNKMDEKHHLDVTLNVVASGKASGQERGEVSNSFKTRKTSAESVATGKNGDLGASSTSSSYSSSDSESADLSMRKPVKRVPFDEFMRSSIVYKKAKLTVLAAREREDALRQQEGEVKLPDYYIV